MHSTHPAARRRSAAVAAAALGILATLLSACAGAPTSEDGGRTRTRIPHAAATTWTLVRLDDPTGIVDDPTPAPTLDLSREGQVSGSDGCSTFGGRMIVPPHIAHDGVQEDPAAPVRFTDLVSSAIACLVSNGIEERYGDALGKVRHLMLQGSGLELTGVDGIVLRFEHGPTATPTPTGAATDLPAEAARRWDLPSNASLGIDLRTPGRILVRAGCLGFTGSLATTSAPDDPAAGAPAGPSVAVAIAELPEKPGTVRCLGFTTEQQDFVRAVKDANRLTVVGDRLYLSGADATLELAAAA